MPQKVEIESCFDLPKIKGNKTGLQPVSRPVEQTVGKKMCSKIFLKNNGA